MTVVPPALCPLPTSAGIVDEADSNRDSNRRRQRRASTRDDSQDERRRTDGLGRGG
jgi:hypothetical protein